MILIANLILHTQVSYNIKSMKNLGAQLPIVKQLKILIVGQGTSGRSCISDRICGLQFQQYTGSIIGIDFKMTNMQYDNKKYKIQVWDTARYNSSYRLLIKSYFKAVNSLIIVFDMTQRMTFQSLQTQFLNYRKFYNQEIPIVICGNKSDLKNQFQVKLSEIEAFQKKNKIKVFLTSAKLNENILQSLHYLIEMRIFMQNRRNHKAFLHQSLNVSDSQIQEFLRRQSYYQLVELRNRSSKSIKNLEETVLQYCKKLNSLNKENKELLQQKQIIKESNERLIIMVKELQQNRSIKEEYNFKQENSVKNQQFYIRQQQQQDQDQERIKGKYKQQSCIIKISDRMMREYQYEQEQNRLKEQYSKGFISVIQTAGRSFQQIFDNIKFQLRQIITKEITQKCLIECKTKEIQHKQSLAKTKTQLQELKQKYNLTKYQFQLNQSYLTSLNKLMQQQTSQLLTKNRQLLNKQKHQRSFTLLKHVATLTYFRVGRSKQNKLKQSEQKIKILQQRLLKNQKTQNKKHQNKQVQQKQQQMKQEQQMKQQTKTKRKIMFYILFLSNQNFIFKFHSNIILTLILTLYQLQYQILVFLIRQKKIQKIRYLHQFNKNYILIAFFKSQNFYFISQYDFSFSLFIILSLILFQNSFRLFSLKEDSQ